MAITKKVGRTYELNPYALLGEYDASKESLLQFRQFITDNRLDDRDTLILLNENTPMKKMPVVNEFMKIADNITTFDASRQLTGYNITMIAKVPDDENKEK